MSETKTKYREPWYLSNDNDTDDTDEWCITDGVETFPLAKATPVEFGLALKGTIERAQVVPQPDRETVAALLGISDEYFDAIQGGEHENWSRLIDHLWKVSEALKALSFPPAAPLTINREVLAKVLYKQFTSNRFAEWEDITDEGDEPRSGYLTAADAVIAHLSAQTVEGEAR